MRFYFQRPNAEVATKCIRVSNTTSTDKVIDELIQRFCPDTQMLSRQSSFALYELHSHTGEHSICLYSSSSADYVSW